MYTGCCFRENRFETFISCGGIAQLGERLNGIQEVSGSIPLTSTKKRRPTGSFFYWQVLWERSAEKAVRQPSDRQTVYADAMQEQTLKDAPNFPLHYKVIF